MLAGDYFIALVSAAETLEQLESVRPNDETHSFAQASTLHFDNFVEHQFLRCIQVS